MTGRTSKNVLDQEAVDLLEQGRRECRLRSLGGLYFVLTGTMSLSRQDMIALIVALGGHVGNSVNSNTDVLISAEETTTSSKYQSARKLGIRIMDEVEFAEWIKDAL